MIYANSPPHKIGKIINILHLDIDIHTLPLIHRRLETTAIDDRFGQRKPVQNGSSDNFKDFVLENYQHVNDVSDFALLAHMSVRNFQRKFKEEFKWPVREWLNERRAERILRDIRNTDKSIAEIATSYGFATASYFTVFCKQYFGMTPSELRRRSKQTATKCRE